MRGWVRGWAKRMDVMGCYMSQHGHDKLNKRVDG